MGIAVAGQHITTNPSGTVVLVNNPKNNIDVFEINPKFFKNNRLMEVYNSLDIHKYQFKETIDIRGKGFVSSYFHSNNSFLIGCRDGCLLEINYVNSKLEIYR